MVTKLSDREMLRRLGAGEAIEAVVADAGMAAGGFEAWWAAQLALRAPDVSGARVAAVREDVEILRDEWGIPHIVASGDEDLFFGYGYAMAQDRLWQLDYLRRKAMGRLAEVLGSDALPDDVVARTVGINRISRREVTRLPSDTLRRLEAFSSGINMAADESRGRLPIEFDLLGYEPEPWTPLDSVAVWCEFRWYLTGRLAGIAIPELAKRALGDAALYRAFLTTEADDESIVPEGSYPSSQVGVERASDGGGGLDEGLGSNNWVVGGERTTNGLPIVASDPHIAFGSVSCWYETHLSGGPFNVVGTGYVGVPCIVFGRTERVAWGLTNNICSQRDLYQERMEPDRPGHFLFDGEWEPAKELTEHIAVRGGESVDKTVRYSRNGPIVDELLPPEAKDTGPVSLRWVGQSFSDEISCYHAAYQARNCAEFREALREWRVPTWSFGFADVDGHIGYQSVGRIPIRSEWERGYRPGWDPEHQWQGFIPFDGMPALADPPQGWVRSANNRTAPDDFPYPLSGMWPSGLRARRIRQMIEASGSHSRDDVSRMQMDVLTLRAVEAVPALLGLIGTAADPRVQAALGYLESWDRRMEPDLVAATIFEEFFRQWSQAVAAERFPEDLVPTMGGAVGGLAVELLSDDRHGWSRNGRRDAALSAMTRALDELAAALGPDTSRWTWGRVHAVTLAHRLSGRGDLGRLLNRGGEPVGGSGLTVCNVAVMPPSVGVGAGGANYRLVADLSESPPGLWAVDHAGQSGHPGSPHYCDQFTEWVAGRQHYLPMDRERAEAAAKTRLRLEPS